VTNWIARCSIVAACWIFLADSALPAPPLERRYLRIKFGRNLDHPEMPDWAIEIRVREGVDPSVTGGTYYVYNEREQRLLAGGVLDTPSGLAHLFARHLFDGRPTDRPGDHVNAVAFLHEKPQLDRPTIPVHVETAEVILKERSSRETIDVAWMENEYATSSVPLRLCEGESVEIRWKAPNGLTGYRIGGGWALPPGPGTPDPVPRLFADDVHVVDEELPAPAFEGTIALVLDAALIALFEDRGYGHLVIRYRTVIATEGGEPVSDWMHSGWIAITTEE
jgi:hypothetical protein